MSPLPSISHRLFVAALGPRKPARAKAGAGRPGVTSAEDRKSRDADGRSLRPLAGRLDTPVFVAET